MYIMSDWVQYVQLLVRLNARIVTLLFTADPFSYVTLEGVALFRIEIGSIAVWQVGADDVSVQASNPSGAGPQRKFTV